MIQALEINDIDSLIIPRIKDSLRTDHYLFSELFRNYLLLTFRISEEEFREIIKDKFPEKYI